MQRPRFDDEFSDLAGVAYRVAYRILGDRPSAEDIAQVMTLRPVDTEILLVERVDLQRALLELPKRQREAVVLRYIADLSEADVAALLGCSPGTIKSHLNRGTTRLRLALHDSPGGL